MAVLHVFDDAYYLPDPEGYDPYPVDVFGEYDSVSDGEFDPETDSLEAIEASIAAWEAQHAGQFNADVPF